MRVKKMSNKGFTLIELLATIFIVSLVLGLTTYGIITSVKKTKEQGTVLSISSIKEAARLYSNEFGEDGWKKFNNYDNDYFCVTIEELINEGMLDKKAKSIENGGELVSYVAIIKDKTTKVIKDEKVLTEKEASTEAYEVCTGNIRSDETLINTKINGSTSYSDTIEVDFSDPKFESDITNRYCVYGDSSSTLNNEGKIEQDLCSIENLNQSRNYYVRICAESKNGSSSCSSTVSIKTEKIKEPNISIVSNSNSIKITYYDDNILGEKYYYFKSTIDSKAKEKVRKCTLSDNKFTCDTDSTESISKDEWYITDNKEIELSYNSNGNIKITAETRDKTNNVTSVVKEFSSYKTTFKKGTADTIDKQTDDIEKYCLADKGASCKVESPSIEKADYSIVGWNSSNIAITSEWNPKETKNISKDNTYYPIIKSKVIINFSANGGSVNENTGYKFSSDNNDIIYKEGKKYQVKLDYDQKLNDTSLSEGLPNYNNSSYLSITKDGNVAGDNNEWKCLSGNCTKETYDQKINYSASDFCNGTYNDCEVTLGVNWEKYDEINDNRCGINDNNNYHITICTANECKYDKLNGNNVSGKIDRNKLKTCIYTIKYDANGGNNAPSNQTKKHGEDLKISSTVPTKTGHTFTSWNTKKDGSGTSYRVGDTYKKEESITLYAQWRKNKVYIYFGPNGGTVEQKNGFGIDKYYIVNKDDRNYVFELEYGTSTGEYGLPDYNNPKWLNITKKDSIAVAKKEWYCYPGNDCTGNKTYDQNKKYNASDFCDASKGDCKAVLLVNWTSTKKTMYINSSTGANCRSGAGTDYNIVTAYSCGTKVEVDTNKAKNGWYYIPNKDCYVRGDLLSSDPVNCNVSSGGTSQPAEECWACITDDFCKSIMSEDKFYDVKCDTSKSSTIIEGRYRCSGAPKNVNSTGRYTC